MSGKCIGRHNESKTLPLTYPSLPVETKNLQILKSLVSVANARC